MPLSAFARAGNSVRCRAWSPGRPAAAISGFLTGEAPSERMLLRRERSHLRCADQQAGSPSRKLVYGHLGMRELLGMVDDVPGGVVLHQVGVD